MFDLAIDSKLRGCDVVKVRISDLVTGGRIRPRAMVVQQKTGRPVQFEMLESTKASMLAWLERRGEAVDDFVFRADPMELLTSAPASMRDWLMNR